MLDITSALDSLVGSPTTPPRAGSQPDRATGAALALIALMRLVDRDAELLDVQITPRSGRLTLQFRQLDTAEALAHRLALPEAALVVELDDGWLCRRWSGQAFDWPVAVLHMFREGEASR